MKQNKTDTKQVWLWSGLFGICFSAANVWGYQLEKEDHINFGSQTAAAAFFLLTVLITVLTRYSWKLSDGFYEQSACQQKEKT